MEGGSEMILELQRRGSTGDSCLPAFEKVWKTVAIWGTRKEASSTTVDFGFTIRNVISRLTGSPPASPRSFGLLAARADGFHLNRCTPGGRPLDWGM